MAVRRRVPQKIENEVLDIAQELLEVAAKFVCTPIDRAQRVLHDSYLTMRKNDIADGLDLVDDDELDPWPDEQS